jgi:hypothetical protein
MFIFYLFDNFYVIYNLIVHDYVTVQILAKKTNHEAFLTQFFPACNFIHTVVNLFHTIKTRYFPEHPVLENSHDVGFPLGEKFLPT